MFFVHLFPPHPLPFSSPSTSVISVPISSKYPQVLKEIDEQTKRDNHNTSLLNNPHNHSAHNPYKATTPL